MNDADGSPLKTPLRPLLRYFWIFVLTIVLPGMLLGLALAWWSAQELVERQEREAAHLASDQVINRHCVVNRPRTENLNTRNQSVAASRFAAGAAGHTSRPKGNTRPAVRHGLLPGSPTVWIGLPGSPNSRPMFGNAQTLIPMEHDHHSR